MPHVDIQRKIKLIIKVPYLEDRAPIFKFLSRTDRHSRYPQTHLLLLVN